MNMDPILNFGASVLAFGAMYLLGRITAKRDTYREGHRDGYREGLEYSMRCIKVAVKESGKPDKVTP
jgi:hypothetical protein